MARGKARLAKRRSGRAAPKPPARRAAGTAARSAVLKALKRLGPMTTRELATELDITYEAVRQQLAELARARWIAASRAPPAAAAGAPGAAFPRPGPASQQYRLSAVAEHLFPKRYDALSAELVQHLRESFGGAGVVEVLSRMTEARVRHWAPRLKGLSLKDKLKALTALYQDQDAYMKVDWRADGPALIERNCPFLNVAQKHPAICSVSINTLERLLGCRVVREERFQAGHGRCVFRLRMDEPRAPEAAFALESGPAIPQK
jgi:predicted ArsR family transcriptional regulator